MKIMTEKDMREELKENGNICKELGFEAATLDMLHIIAILLFEIKSGSQPNEV